MRFKIAFLFALLSGQLLAQSTITTRESEEIKFAAKRKIEKGLSDLMNTIIQEDIGDAERGTLIRDSYLANTNKIFLNEKAILEDDINPNHNTADNFQDFTVERYLKDLDLFYAKSNRATINFTNISSSNVKKSDHLYVKVYFESKFVGTHKQITKPYETTKRVAELLVEKVGKKWATYISRISFYRPEDSTQYNKSDVLLFENVKLDTAKISLPDSTLKSVFKDSLLTKQMQDSLLLVKNQMLQKQKEDENRQIEEERKKEQKELETYESLKKNAQNAFTEGDYELSLQAYNDAEKINKSNGYNDYEPIRGISRVKKKIAYEEELKKARIKRETYASAIAKAKKNEKLRNYQGALTNFRQAFEVFPDSADLYTPKLKTLNTQLRIQTEMGEKFKAGNYKLLLDDYTRLIKESATNSDYFAGRGKSYFMLDDLKRAEKDLNMAIELDFENSEAYSYRAKIYEKTNQIPKAIADYTNYLNLNPEDDEVFAMRGALRKVTSNIEGAISDYSEAIRLQPNVGSYLYNRGLLFYNKNDFQRANEDFKVLTTKQNADINGWYYLGLSYYNLGDFANAGQSFKKSTKLGLDKDSQNNIAALSNIFYDKGQGLLNRNQIDSSLTYLTDATLLKYDNWIAWYRKGEAYEQQNSFESALSSYDSTVKYNETYADGFYRRGIVQRQLKKPTNAIADFLKSVTLNPNHWWAWYEAGVTQLLINDFQSASYSFSQIKAAKNQGQIDKKSTLYPTTFFVNFYHHLGESLYKSGRLKEAITEFSEGLKLDEKSPEMYFDRGQAYFKVLSFKDAIADYDQAIVLKPIPKNYMARAKSYMKLEKYAESNADLWQVEQLDSSKVFGYEASRFRGLCELNLGNYEAAKQNYGKAQATDSTKCDSTFYFEYTKTLLLAKDSTESIKSIDKLLSFDQDNAYGIYFKACYFLLKNADNEALDWFKKALIPNKISSSFVKKDRVLSVIRPNFRDNKIFKQLIKDNTN